MVATRPFAGYTNYMSSARSRIMDDLYWYPGYRFHVDGTTRFFHFAYGGHGLTGDTIEVPPYETLQTARTASYRVSAGSGRMERGLSRAPFEPGPGWELTPRGTILGGPGDGRLMETDAGGDYVRTVVIPEALLTEPPPFIDGRAIIGVARDPATDVQRVVTYRLR
ncbi:MAG: hypothetical protein LC667_12305 [Thioalkalivibrio sp.]|nr:hypothetical protein [Thioalkalivibrio sp.]